METKDDSQRKLEIRTMAKDMAKLREKATDKQREKIIGLQPNGAAPKFSNEKNLEQERKLQEEKIRREKAELERKLKEEMSKKKLEEDSIRKEEQERKRLEERIFQADLEARRKEAESMKLREEEEKKRSQEIEQKLTEEELKKKLQEEVERKAQETIEGQDVYQKNKEEESAELLLQKQEIEKQRLTEEEKIRLSREQEKAKFNELLNKLKSPVDRIRERMAAKKPVQEKPKPEGVFFKRMPTEKSEVTEPIQEEKEKTPEQIMIEKLQKVEAQREKERQEREGFLQRVGTGKIQTGPQPIIEEAPAERFSLMSKVPLKKTPLSEKIFIRIIVIGFLIALWAMIFTFWYWAMVAKKPIAAEPVCEPPCGIHGTCVATNTCTCTDGYTGATCSTAPTPIASKALITVQATKTIAFNTIGELNNQLSLALKESYPEGQITRILFGDKTTMKYLTLDQLFESIEIPAPTALFQKLDVSDFTFFIYSKEAYNRFGMVVKIKNKETLPTLMKQWEPSMEDNLDNLFIMTGKIKPAIVTYFRTGKYPPKTGYDYRFQTFATNDLGVCYLNVGDYFILTSSFESMSKTIDLLK